MGSGTRKLGKDEVHSGSKLNRNVKKRQCQECQEPISQEAEICPYCGRNQRITKNPVIAAFLSLIVPGAGQLYIGQIWRGVLGALIVVVLLVIPNGFFLAIPVWGWLVYSAFTQTPIRDRS